MTQALAKAMGADWSDAHPAEIMAEIMAEIAGTPPRFAGVRYDAFEWLGSVQWPCNEARPEGTPLMHVDGFMRG